MKTAVYNSGSSSVKFSSFEADSELLLTKGRIDCPIRGIRLFEPSIHRERQHSMLNVGNTLRLHSLRRPSIMACILPEGVDRKQTIQKCNIVWKDNLLNRVSVASCFTWSVPVGTTRSAGTGAEFFEKFASRVVNSWPTNLAQRQCRRNPSETIASKHD